MLTDQEKQQILHLLQHPAWRIIEQFSQYLCNEIKDISPIRDTEWETVKELLLREGQVQGIKRFINELYNTQLNKADDQN